MPNEFEKLVQQKMDELKLVPSEPVWQKVEMQIRKKNDRRRLIFWIPFLGLLLGGGLWIGMNQYSKQVSYNKSNSATEKNNDKNPGHNSLTLPTTNNNSSTTATPHLEKKSSESKKAITKTDGLQNEKIKATAKPKNTGIDLNREPGVQKNISKKIKREKEYPAESKKESPLKSKEFELSKIPNNEAVVAQTPIEQKKESVPNINIAVKTDTTSAFWTDEKKNEPTVSLADSLKKDSVSQKDSVQKQDTIAVKKTNVKKYVASKWKLNLIASAGSSNNTDFDLFSGVFGGGEKSLAAPNYNSSGPGSVTGGFINYGPSSVKKGFSFAIGAVAKKQIAQRSFFSAGLRYNYYSNTIQVGNKINQNRVFMDFSVSQYYSNTGTSLQAYRNQYHFVSIPLAIDWQVLKKLPLNFSPGLSLQYLFKTNGLVFDYSNQSYFNSKDAFNRLQLFFESALTYSVTLKQKALMFGPQLQYGLKRLEKNNSSYRLTSYGLKAQLQFGKK